NDTGTQYEQGCIHHLFEAQARRTPDATAARMEHSQISYRELNLRANRLAHYLRKRGVGLDVRVGLYTERSLDTLVGVLGILKAGAAYVPFDTSYPAERLAYLVKDSQVEVVVTHRSAPQESLVGVEQRIWLDN